VDESVELQGIEPKQVVSLQEIKVEGLEDPIT